MSYRNDTLSQPRLKEILEYQCETGDFIWKYRTSNRIKINDIAGCKHTTKDGKTYILIRIDSVLYSAHRLAWFYVYGNWPLNEIDHIDGNGTNNKLNNLREATREINSKNIRLRTDNKTGHSGINWREDLRKWRVSISIGGKLKYYGCYKHKVDAVIARKMAEYENGFHLNHGAKRPL